MLVLKELGFQVECYYASEVNKDAITVASIRHEGNIQHIGDVREIDTNKVGLQTIKVAIIRPILYLWGEQRRHNRSLHSPWG